MGGHLTSVANGYENAMLIETAQAQAIALPFYIGLTTLGSSNWSWSDGANITYLNWAAGQPNVSQQCVVSGAPNGIWSSKSCADSATYVCAVSANSYVTAPTCPPAPSCPPPPAVPGHCQSEWTYLVDTDFCYKSFLSANFDEAEQVCLSSGAHLASIHSTTENRFVAGFTRTGEEYSSSNSLTWIGLHQANYPADTTWTWTDGTAVDYLNWAPTQPSNSDGKEHCVEIYSDHLGKDPAKDNSFQKWNDYQCTETLRAFVCKKAALH